MKKKYLTVLIIAVVVAALALIGNQQWSSYYNGVNANNVPVTPISVAEQSVLPESAEIAMPLLSGAQEKFPQIASVFTQKFGVNLEKSIDCVPGSDGTWQEAPAAAGSASPDATTARSVTPAAAAGLGLLGEAPYTFVYDLPDSMHWSVNLVSVDASGAETSVYTKDGADQSGPGGLSDNVVLRKAGNYAFIAEGSLGQSGLVAPKGTVHYRAEFSVKNPDPVLTAGKTKLLQGDILSLKITNVPDGTVPEIDTKLGEAVFTKGIPGEDASAPESATAEGFSSWYAAVPVSNSRALGDYPVKVQAGDLSYELTVTVGAYDFKFQNMTIDTSVPSVAAAVSGDALKEFSEKVTPLLSVFSDERYWDGYFIWPVDMGPGDFISTEFGEIRVTNGDPNSRRSHLGMDIAVSAGTPVHASGAGKVLLAEFLLNTGNTVIIDHGGGLKSFYYHMSALDTTAGTIVKQGDLIGKVGSTGYSTGPHLHFEMRIGDQPINPSMLFDPGAGLYSAE